MKFSLLGLLLLLTYGNNLLSQDKTNNIDPVKNEVKTTFQEYWKYTEDKNVEKIMDMLYPKLFDQVPREAMQQAMSGMFLDPTLGIEMKDNRLKNISDIITEDEISFSKIDYSFTLLMSFTRDKNVTKKEHTETSQTMLEIFKTQYGESVTYDKKANTFSIYPDGHLLAIQDPAIDDNWRFLEIKQELLPILEKILGKKTLKKLDLK